jgi:flavin-dependent dehydrogenase
VDFDVLVIGGGPGGSTAATLLAQRGWDVGLVERERHPRFHIGESLLPMNLPIFERLGVLEEIERMGVKKTGADFAASAESPYVRYPFGHALAGSPGHAFQVHRAELDALLFRNAAEAGVTALEGVGIHDLEVGASGVVARGRDAERGEIELRARHLVDASGQATLGARKLGVDKQRPRHKSAALFGHFRGVQAPTDPDETSHGNIVVHRLERGWLWLIPLSGGVTSIGVVGPPALVAGADEATLRRRTDQVPAFRERMHDAELVDPVRTASNYGYRCARIGGRGWVMVGDAYAFLDPVFSSGVYLAMKSAELASDVVDGALRDPAAETRLLRNYQRTMDSAHDDFAWFIERFTDDGIAFLFHQPNNDYQIVQAIISMLAGDVFDNQPVRRRLRAFKAAYYFTRLNILRIQLSDAIRGRTHWRDLLRKAHARTFAP